jgi:hypothetical protein
MTGFLFTAIVAGVLLGALTIPAKAQQAKHQQKDALKAPPLAELQKMTARFAPLPCEWIPRSFPGATGRRW